MGSYDIVEVRCPHCGAAAEFQSKAGECRFERYTIYTAPPAILGSLHADTERCRECNWTIQLAVATLASVQVYPPKDT